jgi:hypothetical protein
VQRCRLLLQAWYSARSSAAEGGRHITQVG